jgi:hypothetical protein
MMLDAQHLQAAPGLHYYLDWPRLDDGGADLLDQTCTAKPKIKLIIIDTWKRISPRRPKNQDAYEHENNAAAILQKLAAKHQLAIVIVHHSRKGAGSEDFVDDVLGSTGLTGAVDTIIGFRRKRGSSDAEISIAGRDVDECERALSGDQTSGLWRLLDGDAKQHRVSRQRQAIIDLLKDGKLRDVKQISDCLGVPYDNARVNCANMLDAGQLTRIGKAYGLP